MDSSIPPMIDVGDLIRTDFCFALVNMGTNQTSKRFYQVKVKGLDITSIKELG